MECCDNNLGYAFTFKMGTDGINELLKYDEIFGAVSMSNYWSALWKVAELFYEFFFKDILNRDFGTRIAREANIFCEIYHKK